MGNNVDFANYKVGDKDSKGRIIEKIYSHTEDYIIYQTGKFLLLEGNDSRLNESPLVQMLLQQILALTPAEPSQRDKVFANIAMGLTTCLTGDSELAVKSLEKVRRRLTIKPQQKGQLIYFLGSFLVTLAFVVLAIVTWFNSDPENTVIPELIIYCISIGAIGGVFSVMSNLKNIDVEDGSGNAYLISSGAVRILISVIGGFFLFIAIRGELIFPDIDSNWALYTLAFLAGFSEKLVPNKLKTLEDNSL